MGECPFRLLWANGSMLCFTANNQRYSWLTRFLIYWTALNLLLKQSIGFSRLFLSTGGVCFQKSVRVSSPPNLAVLKNHGAYEAKVNAELTVDNRHFEAREKTVRVHVESKTQLSVTAVLFGVLILLVIGIVVVTVRIGRR